ncbi:MAG: C-terminal binding protein [Victivallales bacterium]
MKNSEQFLVLRLNSVTMPMENEERGILSPLNAKIIEIEGNSDDEISAAAENADAVMIVSSYIRTSVFHAMKKCRIISRMGTGYDKIDIDQATRQGIIVTNVPDFSTDEVADHTLALLLSVARRIKECDVQMRKGKRPEGTLGMHRLSAQTAGLVGFGRIGRAVGKRCRSFGMKVLVFDPAMTPELAAKEDVVLSSFEQVLEASDYICLLCPLMPSTREMIAMPQLKKMKKTAVLVNTGRGELVKEPDLAQALREHIIRSAAVDVFAGINVFAPEGFPADHPFFGVDNMLLTPHIAAISEESLECVKKRSAEAVVDVLTGKWPRHPINPDVKPWFPIKKLQ